VASWISSANIRRAASASKSSGLGDTISVLMGPWRPLLKLVNPAPAFAEKTTLCSQEEPVLW
jgi:hypothetical protein